VEQIEIFDAEINENENLQMEQDRSTSFSPKRLSNALALLAVKYLLKLLSDKIFVDLFNLIKSNCRRRI
jgi:hypothetical protein